MLIGLHRHRPDIIWVILILSPGAPPPPVIRVGGPEQPPPQQTAPPPGASCASCYCADCMTSQQQQVPPPQQQQQPMGNSERQKIEDEILLRQRELDSCWQVGSLTLLGLGCRKSLEIHRCGPSVFLHCSLMNSAQIAPHDPLLSLVCHTAVSILRLASFTVRPLCRIG